MWVGDRAYSDLMKELWGSPSVWNVKKTYVEVARKLGIDEETVRNRIKYLRESGFLLGWRLVPNPALLGRTSSFLFVELEDGDSKEEIISKISGMDGVVVIASVYGVSLLVTFFDDVEGSHSKKISDLGIRGESFTTPGMNLPHPVIPKMTVTDWRIARLMLRDGERKVQDVAREIKASTKTVNRRLGEMMSSRAVFLMPLVNLKKAGGVAYQLLIRCDEEKRPEVERDVSSRIENLVFRASASKGDLIFGFNGTNVAEGTELLRWVRKKVPGVKSARMNIVEQVVHVFDWLEKEVDRQIELQEA